MLQRLEVSLFLQDAPLGRRGAWGRPQEESQEAKQTMAFSDWLLLDTLPEGVKWLRGPR